MSGPPFEPCIVPFRGHTCVDCGIVRTAGQYRANHVDDFPIVGNHYTFGHDIVRGSMYILTGEVKPGSDRQIFTNIEAIIQ